MRRLILAVIVLMAAPAGPGCNSTPTAPSKVNVAGRWTGTTCAPVRITSCAIEATIEQTGTSLTGTWSKTASQGRLTGSVSGATVLLYLSIEFPMERISLTVSGDSMAGPYGNGTISLTR